MRNLLLVLALPLLLGTTVYTWTDADGQVHFSDEPRSGAKELKLRPAPAVPADELPAAAEQYRGQAGAAYQRFELLQPAEDAVVRDNRGQVPVTVEVEPALRDGHRIRILLDGEPWGEQPTTRATRFSLREVTPGSHRLELILVDRDQRELARAASTFHLQRAATGQRAR